MASLNVAKQRYYSYIRRSQDSGTGVSEELQREKIEQWATLYDHEILWLPPDLDASSRTLDRPSLQKALNGLAAGEADGIVAAYQSRLTRDPAHWSQLVNLAVKQGWNLCTVDTKFDLTTPVGRLMAGVMSQFDGYEYEVKKEALDDARRNAVLTHGVHGGERAPFGYEFTTRGHDRKGKAMRGPLTPNADAPRVVAAFQARANGAPWKEVVRILGANSQGAAVQMLANRAYLGEARSGEFVKPGAHPALVTEELFIRANRKKVTRSVSYGDREGAPLGGGILRCWSCRRALTREPAPRGTLAYKCKNLACTNKVTIQAARIEPYVIDLAKGWHALEHPNFALTRAVEDAMLPALEDAHRAAEAELAEVEAAHERGELTPSAYGKALTAAEKAVQETLRAVEEAEAGKGWLGLTPEKVAQKLGLLTETVVETKPLLLGPHIGEGVHEPAPEGATFEPEVERVVGWDADAETVRSFVREIVQVYVLPVGQGRKVPVEQRIKWQPITPVVNYAAMPEGVLEGMIEEFSAEVETHRAKVGALEACDVRAEVKR